MALSSIEVLHLTSRPEAHLLLAPPRNFVMKRNFELGYGVVDNCKDDVVVNSGDGVDDDVVVVKDEDDGVDGLDDVVVIKDDDGVDGEDDVVVIIFAVGVPSGIVMDVVHISQLPPILSFEHVILSDFVS